MNHDGLSVTALMVLVAFAIERITSGVLFLLSCVSPCRRFFSARPPDNENAGERRYKFVYFLLAGAFAIAVVLLNPKMRILAALDMDSPELLDVGLTWLVLVAGADRIADLVGGRESAAEAPPKPIQIEGTVTLKEDERVKAQSRAA